jgi:phosphoribosylglycinamide formyltransferase-1
MKRIAVFASGNGSNFASIVEACKTKKIDASVILLVCDKPNAYVRVRAAGCFVPCFVFDPKKYADKTTYETEIVALLRDKKIDLVCLAGYMRIVGATLLNEYGGRILNIHPSLLPAFKGAHAIDDAWQFGAKVFGATVHLIDHTVDGGTIVAQRAFEYYDNSRKELEAKIHSTEHALYTDAINMALGKRKTP